MASSSYRLRRKGRGRGPKRGRGRGGGGPVVAVGGVVVGGGVTHVNNYNNNNNNNNNINSGHRNYTDQQLTGTGRGGGGRGGRGRGGGGGGHRGGGGSGSGSGSGGRGSRGGPQQKATTTPTTTPKLKNGEKGADTHTVSESERIKFTKILMQLREKEDENDDDGLEFPSTLTNTERKFIHELASQLGLVSKSTGKGENRQIKVTKRSGAKNKSTHDVTDERQKMPNLSIGPRGVQALQKHLKQFPPTATEALEAKETGSSLIHALEKQHHRRANDDDDDDDDCGSGDIMIADALNQLGLGTIETVPIVQQPAARYVDLSYRASRYEDYQRQKRRDMSKYVQCCVRRSKLPAYALQNHIVQTVANNPVTIIQGETGCGKSTQCPQFLLDANPTANIVVTQPRRISAISIAERVAEEQCLETGGLIGYQVRLDSSSTKDTQLLFVTPGILLRKLQGSSTLNEYTHVIIDEIHERDKFTDFLLIALRDLIPTRPDLRLVLMSATLQTDVLINYFGGGNNDHLTNPDIHDFYKSNPPARIEIEGRTFPVQEFFLEHVLAMTDYVTVDENEIKGVDDDVDDGEDGDGVVVMTMEELDVQLKNLLLANEAAASDPGEAAAFAATKMTCVMCNESFKDELELGLHIAVCTGSSGIDTCALLPNTNNFNGYVDYDLDNDTEKVHEYDFQTAEDDDFSDEDQAEEGDKWDGTGVFQADYVVEANISPKEDALLNRYQTMHDDEQVDTSLLIEILHYIVKSSYGDGAILVFLPGWQEISEVAMELEYRAPFSNQSKYSILPLHSGIPSSDQRKVLRRPKPGVRKIILSTNIAETSLTIEDVAFVVDSGRAKEKNYDPHLKTSTLQPTWISKASCKQRKGRAGRTKAGVCFHMFSSRRHQNMEQFRESELLRTPLEEMCLMSKKLGLAPGGSEEEDGIPAFLSKAISPPHEKSITNAIELLIDLGALLPETNDLTDLGKCLSVLSLEPRVGKMVIWSYLLGCSSVAAQMAVAMSYKSPFTLPPPNMRRAADSAQVELSQGSESDQVTVFNALVVYDQLKRNGAHYNFCRRNYLNPATMQMISDLRQNLKRELSSLGFPNPMSPSEYHNRYDRQDALWHGAIAAGLYPNVATRKTGAVNFSTMTNQKCKIQVGSVNGIKGQPLNGKCQIREGEIEFVCFGEMVKKTRLFMCSQTTHLVSCLPLLLLCGTTLRVSPYADEPEFAVLNLDDWLVLKTGVHVAAGIVVLRKRLDAAFKNSIKKPSLFPGHLNGLEKGAIETLGLVLISGHKSSNVRR